MEQIHILLVEDNEGDILLTKEALDDAKIKVKLTILRDGQEAINYMTRKGNYANALLPDLVLLDVNLPKKNGHEVLKSLKENDDIKQIPIIMLTTSSSEKDINLAYHNYANCYITKPIEVADFLKVVSSIENFWISLVKLPTNKSNN